ncbi:MAG: membrane protein insertase YidC [Flavobacteriaceae bacterium]
MPENRNYILAIALSMLVLIAWHFLVNVPEMQRREAMQAQQQEQAQNQAGAPGAPSGSNVPAPSAGGAPQAPASPQASSAPAAPGATPEENRTAALAASPRVPIETKSVSGTISLRGGRIDDLLLNDYHVTVDPGSERIELFSPSRSTNPYYAEFGWVSGDKQVALPGPDTEWQVSGGSTLTASSPVTLTWSNGAGLTFTRRIAVDSNYMFTITDTVQNATGEPVTLHPYGLVSRHGKPKTKPFYILHEGLIGVLGSDGLKEVDYSDVEEAPVTGEATGGWLGITDKYWAAVLIPDQTVSYKGRFTSGQANGQTTYQADFLLPAVSVPAGGGTETTTRLFAGAKQVSLIDNYEKTLGVTQFELLIDWGWFYFLTKPLFFVIDWLYRLIGNFGIAILVVTVLVKALFFPLANKSYESMSKMKKVQPLVQQIRERYAEDKMKQQQAMMELYKKEKINPLSGCLPIVIQIPVFFALYKVLFVTIEMRHAPFFGWIRDLSAPDPTTVFNLFGLIPWDPPSFLMIGIWPLIMGVTMFLQMRLNPPPPDPTQAMIFNWMPLVFTFMLATFPAGLVIYWAWNNTLSIIQQSVIMRRLGVKVELWDNVKALFTRKKSAT